MRTKYLNLASFCQYFRPSWKSDFGSVERVIQLFLENTHIDTQIGVAAEIPEFLEEFPDDQELLFALAGMGFYYNPHRLGLTQREWLRDIQKRISARVDRGVPTTPSDKKAPENQTGIKLSHRQSKPALTTHGIAENTSNERLRRRQHRYKTRFYWFGPALVVMLVVAALWEAGYRGTKKAYTGTGVEISRFGGFQSMLRQLLGIKPRIYQSRSPQSLAPDKSKRAYVPAQSSRARLAAHHKTPGVDEEFVFEINLYKNDGWFHTGIPIAVGNLVWAYTPSEEPDAAIVAKIAGNIKQFHPGRDANRSLNLSVVIVNHEVEYDHVLLRSDQIEHLALKLEGSPTHEPVRLFVRVDLININGVLDATRQRQIALIEHSSKFTVC